MFNDEDIRRAERENHEREIRYREEIWDRLRKLEKGQSEMQLQIKELREQK